MKPHKDDQIVADGAERVRATEDYHDKAHEIRMTVTQEYQAALGDAGLIRCGLIRIKMWHEIRQAVRKLAPDEALYLKP